jgi:hypothetical protein
MQLVKAIVKRRDENLTSQRQHDAAAAAAVASLPLQPRIGAEHTCKLCQAELVAGPVELVIQQQQPAPRRDEAQPTHTNLWGQWGRKVEGRRMGLPLDTQLQDESTTSKWQCMACPFDTQQHMCPWEQQAVTCKHAAQAGATIALAGGKGSRASAYVKTKQPVYKQCNAISTFL